MSIFEQMTDYGHERVAFHHDEETGLRAIIAIHSTALGNALGGTRRWHYASETDAVYDVLRLSQGMTYKAACSGLPMGGAKSVIFLPMRGQRATEAEARAMGRFVDTFAGEYIAAEDVGVDTQFVDWMAHETKHVMGGETVSSGGDPSPYTAQGVVNSMKACLKSLNGNASFEGVTVAIQGLGSVGTNMTRILTSLGAHVIGSDINAERVQFCVDKYGLEPTGPEDILTTKCDVLAPCALGGVINGTTVRELQCRIVCGGANNVLDDPDEDAVVLKNRGILYSPDFVANAGGLIHLAGLYLGMTMEQLKRKNDEIEATTTQVLSESANMPSTHAAAITLAKRRIAEGARKKQEKVHAG